MDSNDIVSEIMTAGKMLEEITMVEWNRGIPFCKKCGKRLEKKNRTADNWHCPQCNRLVKWNETINLTNLNGT